MQQGERAASETERVQHLAEAVDLYGGELLPGYYQDWILPEQQRLAERYCQAVRQLMAHLEQSQEWERAIAYARRAVALVQVGENKPPVRHCEEPGDEAISPVRGRLRARLLRSARNDN